MSLSRKTGLKYIPLYTHPTSPRTPQTPSFTDEEICLYQRRYEEGYDLSIDSRYNCRLKMYHPSNHDVSTDDGGEQYTSPSPIKFRKRTLFSPLPSMALPSTTVSCLQSHSYSSAVLSKILNPPTPVVKVPALRPGSCGRVLTSAENLQILEKKQQKKQEEAIKKLRKKQEREEKIVTFRGK